MFIQEVFLRAQSPRAGAILRARRGNGAREAPEPRASPPRWAGFPSAMQSQLGGTASVTAGSGGVWPK